jgi:hypothetical protein
LFVAIELGKGDVGKGERLDDVVDADEDGEERRFGIPGDVTRPRSKVGREAVDLLCVKQTFNRTARSVSTHHQRDTRLAGESLAVERRRNVRFKL